MVNYVGTYKGVEFDRNQSGYPFEFVIGDGKVVKGWDIALRTMAIGDSCELELLADYGYGDVGSPGPTKATTIPPGATINFQVEVVNQKGLVKSTVADDDRARLVELREERARALEEAKNAKELKEKSKADAQAAYAAKKAVKGKKGKGGGGGGAAFVKKEKVEKPVKVKKQQGPKRAEKQAAAAAAAAAGVVDSSSSDDVHGADDN